MRTRSIAAPALRVGLAVVALAALSGCTSSSDAGATSTSRTDRAASKRLELRPVLEVSISPAEGETTTAPPGLDPHGIVAPSVDGTLTYVLGPVAFDGSAFGSAEAELADTWLVWVTVDETHRSAANDALNDCYNADPTCPDQGGGRGSIAILLDGAVLSSPAVNGPDLADDRFSLVGDFTRKEAGEIEAIIDP